MIFLRLARFFRRFREYVCPAFSAPLFACTAQAGGFRSGVLRTPRLNTMEGNPVQLGRGQKTDVRDQKSEVRGQRSEIGGQRSEDRMQRTRSPVFVK